MDYDLTDFLKPHTIAQRSVEWKQRFVEIIKRDGPICHICGKSLLLIDNLDYEQIVQDHIKPNTQGGPDGFQNRGLAHASCDALRGSHNIIIARAYISAWKDGSITRKQAKEGLHSFQPPTGEQAKPKTKEPVKQAAPPPLNKQLIKPIVKQASGSSQEIHIHIHVHTCTCDKI